MSASAPWGDAHAAVTPAPDALLRHGERYLHAVRRGVRALARQAGAQHDADAAEVREDAEHRVREVETHLELLRRLLVTAVG